MYVPKLISLESAEACLSEVRNKAFGVVHLSELPWQPRGQYAQQFFEIHRRQAARNQEQGKTSKAHSHHLIAIRLAGHLSCFGTVPVHPICLYSAGWPSDLIFGLISPAPLQTWNAWESPSRSTVSQTAFPFPAINRSTTPLRRRSNN